MRCSVVIPSYGDAAHLQRALEGVCAQRPTFDWECVVVDDGNPSDDTQTVCSHFADRVTCLRVNRPPGYRNPSHARNVGFKAARGDVVIIQSDSVIQAPGAMQALVDELRPGIFINGTVYNVDHELKPVEQPVYEFSGPNRQRPYFFLGALWRGDLYAVGGNDEDFTAPGFDDDWFADCLTRGLGLTAYYSSRAIGYHLHHERPANLADLTEPSKVLYAQKVRDAEAGRIPWCAYGGPWNLFS